MEEIKKLIGLRLKEARLACDMTQPELAEAVGVSKGAIVNYETGFSAPNEEILINLMKVLHIDANYVYQDMIHKNDYTDEEKHLITLYRNAEPSARAYAFEMLEKKKKQLPGKKHGNIPL